MQTLEIISVNLWQILISLANLLIIFLILKKFLFKPVKKVLSERQAAIDEQVSAAERDRESAAANKEEWEQKMRTIGDEAAALMQSAAATAKLRGDQIISEAKEKADGILRQAETEAKLERQKAAAGIKQEIVDVSALLAEKMLRREIQTADHQTLIDSFINDIPAGKD